MHIVKKSNFTKVDKKVYNLLAIFFNIQVARFTIFIDEITMFM